MRFLAFSRILWQVWFVMSVASFSVSHSETSASAILSVAAETEDQV